MLLCRTFQTRTVPLSADYFCLTDGPDACWAFTPPVPPFEAIAAVPSCWLFCLVPTGAEDAGIFGFAEFVQAFALLILFTPHPTVAHNIAFQLPQFD